MKKMIIKSIMFCLAIATFTSCNNDDNATPLGSLNLNITGLEDLGTDYLYEGWLIVNGAPVTTGTFSVDGSGNLSQSSFDLDMETIDNATTFILTIEPSPDNDPDPSSVHILAGDFTTNNANLSVDHGAALGNSFTTSTGSYILATPTNGSSTNELSGVWWLDPSGPSSSLVLPELPAGWMYEGWAVINGTPVTTGKFTDVAMADGADPYSGTEPGPPFPGEDFLENSPSGLSFPTDLSGGVVVISVEPEPDNSPDPFTLKPLVGNVPSGALDHTSYDMMNNAGSTNPTGIATRN